nr:MAG TPA: hypothetical protein [Caudoviricetes sp.]
MKPCVSIHTKASSLIFIPLSYLKEGSQHILQLLCKIRTRKIVIKKMMEF